MRRFICVLFLVCFISNAYAQDKIILDKNESKDSVSENDSLPLVKTPPTKKPEKKGDDEAKFKSIISYLIKMTPPMWIHH